VNDFKSFFTIAKAVATNAAKIAHKPTLSSVESMAAYAQAIGATGKKASFTDEQKDMMTIDFV
jgi:hypothetical protein